MRAKLVSELQMMLNAVSGICECVVTIVSSCFGFVGGPAGFVGVLLDSFSGPPFDHTRKKN